MLRTELIPATQESQELLVALHGLGDSMEGYRWLPSALQLPSLNVLLVNAPDAYYGGFSWYDYAGQPGPGVERSYQTLAALLDDLEKQGFPMEKTVMFGFSQGCLMTYETGLRYPKKLAGCIGISGYVHEPERLLKLCSPQAKNQQFFITHGTRDSMIPLHLVSPQIIQLQNAGIKIEFHQFDKEHTIIEDELDLIRKFIRKQLPR